MRSIPPEPACQPPLEYIVQKTIKAAHQYLNVCPYAQTLSAWSISHGAPIMFVLPCRRWSCRLCADEKIRRLANAVREARPNRLLTLTVDPSLHESPKAAWNATRRKVPICIRSLRGKFGEIEYLRVTEVTKRGWPHYHLLLRSGFLPHSVVKARWQEMTGARIVDLRQVTKSFSAYTYLVKYLSKLHKLEWTERHVSLSRGFAPKSTWEPENPINYAEGEFHSFHPANFLAERYLGCTVTRLSAHAHVISKGGMPRESFTESP